MKRLAAIALLGAVACSNPSTPAGSVGYCVKTPFTTRTHFYDLQTGPTSTGLGWQLSCINVPITPITFDEPFTGDSAILSRDKLQVAFAVHVVFRVLPDQVRSLMEHYALDQSNPVGQAYMAFLKERLRTIAREELPKYDAFAINTEIGHISQDIQTQVEGITKGSPFEILSMVVGNLQYPQEVADQVAKKIAAQQLLEQQTTQLSIVEKQAEQRVAEAKGIAEAQRIIQATLTNQYLQHEAIEAQKAMVGSPNHTTVYIPVGPMGLPLTGTLSAERDR